MNMQAAEQAQTPSVEERAASALFGTPPPRAAAPAPEAPETEVPEGEPPTAELPEQTEAPAEETFEFEHDGEKWTLPKKLEKAIQNNRDYTQKSQDIANQRRTFEALNEQAKAVRLTQEFERSIADEIRQLHAFDSVLGQPMDTNLSEADLLRAMVQRNQWKEQREALARSVNQKHQSYMQSFEQAQADFKAKSLEAVTKRVPNWSDATWNAVKEHARGEGYTDVELGQVIDPRHQVTLWKAQQYDQLKAKAAPAVSQVKAVKTTPSNPMPQAVKDKLAFNKALQKTTDPIQKRHLVEARLGAFFKKG